MSTAADLNQISDEDLDGLGPGQIEALKAELWEPPRSGLERRREPIVGLGDSWFDYQPAGFDILDFLNARDEYNVIDHGEAGDTLENMAYGTEFKKRSWKPRKPRLNDVIEDLKDNHARVLLVSGGGNDIAGPELDQLLNHAATKKPPLREAHATFLFDEIFRPAFEHIFQRVWAERPDTHIIGHGYGYVLSDGRGVINVFGMGFIGPWLRPAFTRKRITSSKVQQRLMRGLIDRMNDLMESLAAEHPRFHAIDARPILDPTSEVWANELHLRPSYFRKVAAMFHDQIQEVLRED